MKKRPEGDRQTRCDGEVDDGLFRGDSRIAAADREAGGVRRLRLLRCRGRIWVETSLMFLQKCQ